MSRTFRTMRPSASSWMKRYFVKEGIYRRGHLRDGVVQYTSHSCSHHGGCPYCEANRTFAAKRQSLHNT